MSRCPEALENELAAALAMIDRRPQPCAGSWVRGFTPREPRDLGRSPEARTLRMLLGLSRRVRGRPPFDISLLSARPGQRVDDWLLAGVAAFETWLGLGGHDANETGDAVVERHSPAA